MSVATLSVVRVCLGEIFCASGGCLRRTVKLLIVGGLSAERFWRMEELVLRHLGSLKAYRRTLVADVTSDLVAKVVDVAVESAVTATNQPRSSDSSLARLMRLVVRRSSEVGPDELRSQLKDVPREELEAFALLLLELV